MEGFEDLGAIPVEQAQSAKAPPAGPEAFADLGATPIVADPPEPNMAPVKNLIKENFKKHEEENAPAEGAAKKPREAVTFLDSIEAGLQMSVSGLIKRGQTPDIVMGEHPDMFHRIASQVGQLAGDLPAMAAGMIGGAAAGSIAGAAAAGTAGSVVPIAGTIAGGAVGAAVGGGAGAMAGGFGLPAAMRKALMDHYEKGDIQGFDDFWARTSGAFIEGGKGAITGLATYAAGGAAGVLSEAATPIVKSAAQLTAEVATMTTVGAALEGRVPDAQEFLDGAILIGGMHGLGHVGGKLRDTYSKTGTTPAEVVERAKNDPLIQQDLLTTSSDIPKVLADEAGVKVGGDVALKEIKSQTGERGSLGIKDETKTPTTEVPEANAKIRSQIQDQNETPKESYTFRKAYKDFVDRFDPVSQAVKILEEKPETLAADKNPYTLTRMANDAKSKVLHIFERGTLDFKTLEVNGKSFEEIIKPHAEDINSLEEYIVSKRALDIEASGRTSGFDVEAAQQVVEEGKAKFDKASKELVAFQNRNLKYVKDAGVLSEQAYNTLLEANKNYVPFSRILDPESPAAKGGRGKTASLKKLLGSDKAIQSPMLSILENTEALIKLSEKNRAVKSLVELAEKTKDQTLLEKVKVETKATKVHIDEINKLLAANGMEGIDGVESLTVFSRRAKTVLADNEFEFFRDGKREVWKVTDPDVAVALKSLDGDAISSNILMKFANTITGIKRLALTLSPDFQLKNGFRDQLTKGVFSKGTMSLPFFDTLAAAKDIIGKNDNYYNWLKSGGAGGSFLELDNNYLKKDIFKLNEETGFIDQAWNILKKPVDFLHASGSLVEQATRLAEFKKVAQGKSSGPKVFEGGMAAREVTVDFSRIGAKMSALNAITAFQNVSIQGLDRAVRAIKEDPAGVGMRATALITVPSILLWYANHNDERYKQKSQAEKDLFWFVITDDWQPAKAGEADMLPDYLVRQNANGQTEINKGIDYKIPKPQELGILFGSLPERVMEAYFAQNPRAYKDFEKTMMNLVTPSFVPDAISPLVEQKFNKNLFNDSKVIPSYLENVAPEYQYTDYSTESAKQLGKLIKYLPGQGEPGSLASPLVIENYARAWGGAYGQYFLQLADQALIKSGAIPDPVKPAWTVADVPFVKAFVSRHPSAGARSIQDFYEREQKVMVPVNTIKHLAKTGDYEAMQKELLLNEGTANLEQLKKSLSNLGTDIQVINKNKDMSRSDKRQLIDGLYYNMIELSKGGNDMLDAMEEATKDQKKAAGE